MVDEVHHPEQLVYLGISHLALVTKQTLHETRRSVDFQPRYFHAVLPQIVEGDFPEVTLVEYGVVPPGGLHQGAGGGEPARPLVERPDVRCAP